MPSDTPKAESITPRPARRSRRAGLGSLAVIALVLAACGGGTGATTAPAASMGSGGGGGGGQAATQAPGGGAATQALGGGAGATDACTLLTADDIEDVTGLTIASSAKAPNFSIFASACGWELADDDAMVPPSVALGILAGGGRAAYDSIIAPVADDSGYEPIDGLGDVAMDAGGGSVIVVSGDTAFQLQYLAFKDTDVRFATELARKVLANLGR